MKNNLSVIYTERGLADDAMEEALKAIKVNSKNADAYNNLGLHISKGM